MKVRMCIVIPVLLAIAGCASTTVPLASDSPPEGNAIAAAPQQVSAISDALGQRLDRMIATRHLTPTAMTR